MIAAGNRSRVLSRKAEEWASKIAMESDIDGEEARGELFSLLWSFNEKHCNPPKERECIDGMVKRAITVVKKRMGVGTEKDISDRVLESLSEHFIVEEQATGTHFSGRKMRIDAILTPRNMDEWKTQPAHLGVEFKNYLAFRESFDFKDYTKWFAQCHDYADTNWDKYGYVHVFSYNAFSRYARNERPEGNVSAVEAERFWGQLGVGELAEHSAGWPRRKGLQFRLQGHVLWCAVTGLRCGKTWGVNRKFGSR